MTMQAELGISAQLCASIDSLTAEMAAQRAQRDRLVQQIHMFTVPAKQMSLTTGAGVLQSREHFGPRTGQCWDVRRLTASGFTAGTVNCYLNGVIQGSTVYSNDQVVGFPVAGTQTLGKAQLLLQANDHLVFSASGITGSVYIQIAGIALAAPLLGEYLI
jgi:hypothetical protein